MYLDATAAFDSVPHVSFDVSFDHLGAPEDFIGSHRGIIGGHTRVAVTARGVDQESQAEKQEGGAPQGGSSSPVAWVVALDPVLDYMAAAGGKGFQFVGQGEAANTDAFADDLMTLRHASRQGRKASLGAVSTTCA